MPARRWTKDRILCALVAKGDLPPSGTITKVNRQTALVYIDADLRRQLLVYPDRRPGLLQWHVELDIPELRPPATLAFGICCTPHRQWPRTDPELRPGSHDGYDWPVGAGPIDARLVEDVRQLAVAMLWFLRDRRELGRLLLAGDGNTGSWERESITARPWAGAPAAVVQAVILARILSDTELEAEALAKIERERDHLVKGFNDTFPHAVGYWATQIAQHSPVDICDLTNLATRRRTR